MARTLRTHALTLSLACATMLVPASLVTAQAQDKPLVIARDMDINSLDPSRGFCDTCQIVFSSTYARLVNLDKDNKTIVPMLAESWEINADQTKFTFKLNPKAKFSDGSPVEPKDVKWSLERLKNVKGSASYLVDPVKSIETPDAQTVVIDLTESNSEFLSVLTAPFLAIINSDVVAENGGDAGTDAATKDTAEQWLLANSAGAGPFVLSSYSPNQEVRLKRNDNYWGEAPAVSEIIMQQSKGGVSQLQLLEGGTADIAMQVDPTTAKSITNADIVVDTQPSLNMVYVALAPGAKGLPNPMGSKVREAIAHAIDYDGIIDLTVDGKGRRLATPIPEGFPGTGGAEPISYDVEKAKALMAEAGAADGFTIDAMYPNVNQYGVDYTLMMQKIQQDLAEIKIELNLEPVEFSVWRERVNGDGIPLTAVYFAPDFFGTSQYIQYFAMMDGTVWYKRAGAANDPELARPEVAGLLKKALSTGGAESDGYFRELAKGIAEDHIILPILSPDNVFVYRKGLEGLRFSACCNMVLSDISWK
ncbi:ABC transporter substrate-binding protein [Mesorhizobium tianshanense]|uniref:Peptide/nickel transport system substrate-binding protein n=1 Tax=Mesorhizobium tianshanense TaxID=39844 RepID=A0A562P3D0_9HYPH|nr:ABC transporter substrate-binding protein [Mesorhizobium tianshanense]TWI38750.1 peptide/nickel transport system substrate-binding protein [Mesorhizobium tianshanense]GLS36684.1 ABC transporter substrate-binding protein [Mesorhizobium tianshanense]